MITVPQATEKIIKRSRYLTEAMSKGLINASSLARYIHPEVEELTMKKVTRGSIVMAIKRFNNARKPKTTTPLLPEAPDMIVRSNLTLFYVKNSPLLLQKLVRLETASSANNKRALFTYGRAETIILANKLVTDVIESVLTDEIITKHYQDISAITIHLPVDAVTTPGIYNLFIKSLAWEDINLLGILSTETECTLIFFNNDIHTAFGILRSLFDLGNETMSHNI